MKTVEDIIGKYTDFEPVEHLLKTIEYMRQSSETQEEADAYIYLEEIVTMYDHGDLDFNGDAEHGVIMSNARFACLIMAIQVLIYSHSMWTVFE